MNKIIKSGILIFSDITVELLNYSSHLDTDDPYYEKNVVAFDSKGKIKWVVNYPEKDMFVSLKKEDNILMGNTYGGDICDINIETGVATRVGWSK